MQWFSINRVPTAHCPVILARERSLEKKDIKISEIICEHFYSLPLPSIPRILKLFLISSNSKSVSSHLCNITMSFLTCLNELG